MKLYRITFSARKIGALGVWSTYTRDVQANSEDEAILKLYESFEHIAVSRVQVIP